MESLLASLPNDRVQRIRQLSRENFGRYLVIIRHRGPVGYFYHCSTYYGPMKALSRFSRGDAVAILLDGVVMAYR